MPELAKEKVPSAKPGAAQAQDHALEGQGLLGGA